MTIRILAEVLCNILLSGARIDYHLCLEHLACVNASRHQLRDFCVQACVSWIGAIRRQRDHHMAFTAALGTCVIWHQNLSIHMNDALLSGLSFTHES